MSADLKAMTDEQLAEYWQGITWGKTEDKCRALADERQAVQVEREFREPRQWAREFDLEFDCPPLPEGWHDTSWHNDVRPSYEVGQLRVWIDHPVPEERELTGGSRFAVNAVTDAEGSLDGTTLLGTDHWTHVLAFTELCDLSRQPHWTARLPSPGVRAAINGLEHVANKWLSTIRAHRLHVADVFGRMAVEAGNLYRAYERLDTITGSTSAIANEVQPDLGPAVPMSFDEWAIELGALAARFRGE